MKKFGMLLAGLLIAGPVLAQDEEERDPFPLYIGADYYDATVSAADPDVPNLDTTGYRVHFGTSFGSGFGSKERFIGVDVSYVGKRSDNGNPDYIEMDGYGVHLVPTATVLDLFEIAVPLGWQYVHLSYFGAEASDSGISYGLNLQFPFRIISESLPDLRLIGGGLVYNQDEGDRIYGWHAGLQFDFGI